VVHEVLKKIDTVTNLPTSPTKLLLHKLGDFSTIFSSNFTPFSGWATQGIQPVKKTGRCSVGGDIFTKALHVL